MNRLVDRFSAAAGSCGTLSELGALLLDAAKELGFQYVAMLHHSSLSREGTHFIRFDNYPSAWAAELTAGLGEEDPVHHASLRASAAFCWRDLDRLIPLSGRQQLILERSRYFGIGEGLTVPIHVPGEPAGSCSFAVDPRRGLPQREVLSAELIGLHAFEAARRLVRGGLRPTRPHLSRRELQCLRLVSAGKSDAEIGLILGISTETAHQYVKRARAAYGVVSRTQLVVLGLRDSWLTFDEAADLRS